MNRIWDLGEYILFSLHHSRWRYAPMKLIRKPPLKPKEEAEVLLTIGYRQTFKSTFIIHASVNTGGTEYNDS